MALNCFAYPDGKLSAHASTNSHTGTFAIDSNFHANSAPDSNADSYGHAGTIRYPIVVGKWRITGIDVPALASFDAILKAFMQQHNISAGALAVTYKGRLIMAHGYTWDGDESYSIQPTSLFRIASLSKPFTAVAVLKLVQDGKLSLDTKIVDILDFTPPTNQSVDPRLGDVTVAHLLDHRGGWDIEKLGYDPMFSDCRISKSLGVPLPISQANIMTVLSQDSIKLMFSAPPKTSEPRYYAMGWEVRRFGPASMNTWHTGSLDGSITFLVRRSDGVDWAAVFNERESTNDRKGETYWKIDDMLHKAADEVDVWPDHDLFHQFP